MSDNVVEMNAGKSKVGVDEALFIHAITARAEHAEGSVGRSAITVENAVAAFWDSAGTLKDELLADGEQHVVETEAMIKGMLPDFSHLFRRAGITLLGDTKAVTGLEYGIIASILGLVLVTAFKGFGLKLATVFLAVGHSI